MSHLEGLRHWRTSGPAGLPLPVGPVGGPVGGPAEISWYDCKDAHEKVGVNHTSVKTRA
jgi:hypothetical protein